MNNSLKVTLNNLIESGSTSNPALNRLISDYVQYHTVLVIIGGLFSFAFMLLGVFCWKMLKSTARAKGPSPIFETKIYYYFTVLSGISGLFMTLIVAANVSNILTPRQGFAGTISAHGKPRIGSQTDQRYRAFNTWLQTQTTDMPSLIQKKIDRRLEWQRPKAVICTVLLMVFASLSAYIWRALIKRSRLRDITWKLKDATLFGAGLLSFTACLPLMVMVIGNTQSFIAPITLTLMYG